MLICQRNTSVIRDACYERPNTFQFGRDSKLCMCSATFRGKIFENDTSREFDRGDRFKNRPPNPFETCANRSADEACKVQEALLSSGIRLEIARMIRRMYESNTDDLKDVEHFFRPPLQVASDFGASFHELVISCSFGPIPCDQKDFVTVFSPAFGKCYMFNYVGKDGPNPRTINRGGRASGLQLYLQLSETIDLLTPQLGLRIAIHDARQLPFASEHGIDIRPGDLSTIDMEYSEIHRLGPPWGNCVSTLPVVPLDFSFQPYSLIGCERYCFNAEVFNECGCYHPRFLTGTTVPSKNFNICQTKNKQEDECFLNAMRRLDRGEVKCHCPPPCSEKIYKTSMSTGKVNSEFFSLVKLAKSMKLKNGVLRTSKFTRNISMMGLLVYFKTLWMSNITETPIYSWQSLVANIGGNLGLFLGLSLVTFLEVFEFIGDLAASLLRAMFLDKPQQQSAHIHPNRRKKQQKLFRSTLESHIKNESSQSAPH